MSKNHDLQHALNRQSALMEVYAYVREELGVSVSKLVRNYSFNKDTLARLKRGELLERCMDDYFVRFVRVVMDQIRVREMKGEDVAGIRERLLELLLMFVMND